MLSFEYPLVFLILPLFFLCFKYCRDKTFVIYFPHLDLLKDVAKKRVNIEFLLMWFTILGVVSSLASPVLKNGDFFYFFPLFISIISLILFLVLKATQ